MKRQTWRPPKSGPERFLEIMAPGSVAGLAAGLVWALRPGGYLDRQPRVGWFVAAVVLFFMFTWSGGVVFLVNLAAMLVTKKRARTAAGFGPRLVWTILLTGIAGGIGAYYWPHGLVKEYPKLAPLPTTTLPGAVPGAVPETVPTSAP